MPAPGKEVLACGMFWVRFRLPRVRYLAHGMELISVLLPELLECAASEAGLSDADRIEFMLSTLTTCFPDPRRHKLFLDCGGSGTPHRWRRGSHLPDVSKDVEVSAGGEALPCRGSCRVLLGTLLSPCWSSMRPSRFSTTCTSIAVQMPQTPPCGPLPRRNHASLIFTSLMSTSLILPWDSTLSATEAGYGVCEHCQDLRNVALQRGWGHQGPGECSLGIPDSHEPAKCSRIRGVRQGLQHSIFGKCSPLCSTPPTGMWCFLGSGTTKRTRSGQRGGP